MVIFLAHPLCQYAYYPILSNFWPVPRFEDFPKFGTLLLALLSQTHQIHPYILTSPTLQNPPALEPPHGNWLIVVGQHPFSLGPLGLKSSIEMTMQQIRRTPPKAPSLYYYGIVSAPLCHWAEFEMVVALTNAEASRTISSIPDFTWQAHEPRWAVPSYGRILPTLRHGDMSNRAGMLQEHGVKHSLTGREFDRSHFRCQAYSGNLRAEKAAG